MNMVIKIGKFSSQRDKNGNNVICINCGWLNLTCVNTEREYTWHDSSIAYSNRDKGGNSFSLCFGQISPVLK